MLDKRHLCWYFLFISKVMFNPKSQNCCFEIVNVRDSDQILNDSIFIFVTWKFVLKYMQNGRLLKNPVAVAYVIFTFFLPFSSFLLNEKYEFQETVLVLNQHRVKRHLVATSKVQKCIINAIYLNITFLFQKLCLTSKLKIFFQHLSNLSLVWIFQSKYSWPKSWNTNWPKSEWKHSVWKLLKMSHLNFGIFHQFLSY